MPLQRRLPKRGFTNIFAKRYAEGMSKMEYWDPMYEDSTDILARIPTIAAYIYRMKYRSDTPIAPNPDLNASAESAAPSALV